MLAANHHSSRNGIEETQNQDKLYGLEEVNSDNAQFLQALKFISKLLTLTQVAPQQIEKTAAHSTDVLPLKSGVRWLC
jgi:hypothetical protein